MHEPKTYRGVMVSSTFTDMKEHRAKVIAAIEKLGFKANAMESYGVAPGADEIRSSLQMVEESAAYVGVISRKYGQNPYCPVNNKNRLSITELEFNRALELDRPILLFVMEKGHPLMSEDDAELDPKKRKKLDAFRERAKRLSADAEVKRIYYPFASREQFIIEATVAVGRLANAFTEKDLRAELGAVIVGADVPDTSDPPIPAPPALAALPPYLGSHGFVGRRDQLDTLDEWCAVSDQNPMLLFEAIGGTGKSMLAWHWLNGPAQAARPDWAGKLWFSFYEKGATMAGFCAAALAYMQGRKAKDFARIPAARLGETLLAELGKRPWLMVLDGLERVLVAYHRIDAAEMRDEAADTATDRIGSRDPCDAIRPEDDDLLRRLAAAAPSKLLVTSRLTPRALINRSGQPVPGVRRVQLPGLRPADAEAMIRACGVSGDSRQIRDWLKANCDCHPLVIGAVAGLVNDYFPARGDFGRWLADPGFGGGLNLAELDLKQRQNHILNAAIDALSPESRQLLQTLALLHGAADAETVAAFNPHLPPEPKEVEEPEKPESHWWWQHADEEEKAKRKADYAAALESRRIWLAAHADWNASADLRAAPKLLSGTLRDLEARGLLQYDRNQKRYDLHPVVRGVASGRLAGGEIDILGQKLVDHFSARPHDPWEQAETLADLAPGLELVRVLLKMRRYKQALEAYRGDLSHALLYNLDARTEIQALLAPFFAEGWDAAPTGFEGRDAAYLLNDAAIPFAANASARARSLFERALGIYVQLEDQPHVRMSLSNLSRHADDVNALASVTRLSSLAFELAEAIGGNEDIFVARLGLYSSAVVRGDRGEADRLWRDLDAMGRDWRRNVYRTGHAELLRAVGLFQRDELSEAFLTSAEKLAREGRSRLTVGNLHQVRGEWQLWQGQAAEAVTSFAKALRMDREVGRDTPGLEALLLLARHRAGEVFDIRAEVERLDGKVNNSLALAELWRDLGEHDRAVAQALAHHKWAVADGEPYVRRYELVRARALLSELGEPLPGIPLYDPSKEKPLPYEAEIRALIEKTRAEREEREERERDASQKRGEK